MRDSSPLLDVARLQLLAGDDLDLFAELAELFLREGARRLAELERATASSEPAVVLRAAHALRGASLNFGATRLAALATDLEDEARHGRVSAALYEAAVTAYDATRSELGARLAERAAPPRSG